MKPQVELKTNWIFPLNSTDYAVVQCEKRLKSEDIDAIIETLEITKRGIQRSKPAQYVGLYADD